MERFLYDFSLFKWAWTGPIYWGNFLTFVGGFFTLMLIGWLFQRGINPFKIIYYSLFNIIYYIVRLFIVHIINNVSLRNKLIIVLILLLFIPNIYLRFTIIFLVSNIIIWQTLLYYENRYYEFKYGKKTYFLLYYIILFLILCIIKYNIFIVVIPYILVIFHIILLCIIPRK